MDTSINRSTHTRRIVAAMRSISRGFQGSAQRAGFFLHVTLDQTKGQRRYVLEYSSSTRAGTWITVDSVSKEAWISPVGDGMREIDLVWHDVNVHTLLVDHLVNLLASAGYRLMPGSQAAHTDVS